MAVAAPSIEYLQEVVESQKRVINAQREKLQWYEGILSNKDLPINLRLATIAAKKLEETRSPGEDGYYRAHLPYLAKIIGVSPSTMSRGIKNLAACTEAIEHRTEADKDEPYKTIVYIRPTDLLDRPQEIRPIKEIKRHGGDHRVFCPSCGSEDIVEKKRHICRCCGAVVKEFDERPVNPPENDPLHHATGMEESSQEETDELDPLQDATITVDTQVPIARRNALEELQELPQWVVWRYGEKPRKDGKLDKVPYDVNRYETNSRAATNNPDTWNTYEKAIALYEKAKSNRWGNPYAGVGFVFKEGGGLVGIDYDNSLAVRITSYGEISVSGSGVHQFVRGSIPKGVRRNGIEMYSAGRFFTWTGDHLAGTPETIEECQAELDMLYKELVPETIPIQPTPINFTSSGSAEEILEKARNDAKFQKLWSGDASDYPHPDGTPDFSRADLALCEKLIYYGAGGSVSTIWPYIQQSGLMREKWERADYRERTINRALGMQEPRAS